MIDNSPITVDEAIDTLTGYDEQAIEQRFGGQVGDLLEQKPSTGLRALAYVLVARDVEAQEGKDPKGRAYKHVMEMTMKQIAAFWPDEVPEVNPDAPVTPAGEGDSSAD